MSVSPSAISGCILAGALLLVGCSNVKEQLGLDRKAPDEFAVVRRAPLSMPPDFTLRPPQPGERRPQEAEMREQARQALVGGTQVPGEIRAETDTRSYGEIALLDRLGASEADPGIRQIVNRESAALAADDRNFVERLMFWREQPLPGEVIDPAEERERIQQNAALGQPITTGETPTIERKSTGQGVSLF